MVSLWLGLIIAFMRCGAKNEETLNFYHSKMCTALDFYTILQIRSNSVTSCPCTSQGA